MLISIASFGSGLMIATAGGTNWRGALWWNPTGRFRSTPWRWVRKMQHLQSLRGNGERNLLRQRSRRAIPPAWAVSEMRWNASASSSLPRGHARECPAPKCPYSATDTEWHAASDSQMCSGNHSYMVYAYESLRVVSGRQRFAGSHPRHPRSYRKPDHATRPGDAQSNTRAGKWSVREILSHLADCEIVFAFRLRQALAEDHHVIQPFDQDAWAATYSQNDAVMALVVFSAVRQWNVALIQGMSAADLTRTLNHPERGEMTVKVVVATMAGHDINHLGQIEKILA